MNRGGDGDMQPRMPAFNEKERYENPECPINELRCYPIMFSLEKYICQIKKNMGR